MHREAGEAEFSANALDRVSGRPQFAERARSIGTDASPFGTTFANICVIGIGYVGLPAATMFARAGANVVGVDVDDNVVDNLNAGRTIIVEPGLADVVREQVAGGRLSASTAPPVADAFIIAVPTPFHHDGTYAPDISYIEAATRSLAPTLKRGDLVVLESTSPVGTTRHIVNVVRFMRPDLDLPGEGAEGDVDFAYSPERVIPGRTMEEIVSNPRVIGGITPRATQRATALYRMFVKSECLLTDDRTAEMVKLTENTFRDINIALANELSLICDRFGMDVWEVIRLANRHPRVSILSPGPGVGGHCISIDPWFVVSGAPDLARLIKTAREVNDSKPAYVLRKVQDEMTQRPNARIACLGLTYKADIDDFRESPALQIALRLSARWPGRVAATDPNGKLLRSRDPRGGALTLKSLEQALDEADIVVLLVGHREYKSLVRPKGKVIIDTIGLWR
jgi:UDP-N-acetyl-D-mannosaminuronic acid dehydrogenase